MDYFDPATGKKRGLAHVLAATGYSLQGLRVLLKESAFRHELIAAAAILGLYAVIGVPLIAWIASLCLICITLAFEAVNTAIERIVDRTSPEISPFGKETKDIGSFAVFCLLSANGLVVAWVLYERFLA